MANRSNLALNERTDLLGELHPLLQQLGAAEGLFVLGSASAALSMQQVTTIDSLLDFLRAYQKRILLPIELPSIQRAHAHAARNQAREIVALDQRLSLKPILASFAAASQRVGQASLQRLRPLRGERVVQRYLEAIDRGDARGWHTIVYGMTLALYSLPLRQGLLEYARQSLGSFLHSASASPHLSETDCQDLLDGICGDLPKDFKDTSESQFLIG